jgi:hypothetical protein
MSRIRIIQALGAVFFAVLVQPSLWAQNATIEHATIEQRIADLQRQLDELKAELAASKTQTTSSTAATAATAPAVAPAGNAIATDPAASNAVTAPPSAPAAAPNPLAGITSVLAGASLNGLIDGYYSYNAGHPQGGTVTTPFTNANDQFSLNLIELGLSKIPEKDSPLGYNLTLGWGHAMDVVNAGDPGSSGSAQNLKEGYLSYLAPLGKGLQIDFGKFVTPTGAEVIESNQNWQYSRSLLFYYTIPYYHFGLRAKYTFNDKVALTGILVNGWNDISANNTGKTGGLSLALSPTRKFSVTANYLVGPEQNKDNSDLRHLIEAVITYSVTPKLSLQADVDYDRESHWLTTGKTADAAGVAAYVRYAFTRKFALSGRYEYLNDHDGWATATAQHLNEVTITAERKVATHLISRIEYRHDNSNQDFFKRGNSSFGMNQDTATAGLVFVLEPAETK